MFVRVFYPAMAASVTERNALVGYQVMTSLPVYDVIGCRAAAEIDCPQLLTTENRD
jgi:hypothetical protein